MNKNYPQTFKDYCREKGLNENVGNEASRYYDKELYERYLKYWKQSLKLEV